MYTSTDYANQFTKAKVVNDINFIRQLISLPDGGRKQSVLQLGWLIQTCYPDRSTDIHAVRLVQTIVEKATFTDFYSSPYAHFLVLLAGERDWSSMRSYIVNVCSISAIRSDEQVLDVVRECLQRMQISSRYAPDRRSIYDLPVESQLLDHGFRPLAMAKLAANNAVFIYHPDGEPLILSSAIQTHYDINGFRLVFSMENFTFPANEHVEVERHDSLEGALPELHNSSMDAACFRRYFDTTKRAENIKALMNIIH